MAKIQLGKRPKTFNHEFSIKLLDGTDGSMSVVYKYRTRKEFGALVDELAASADMEVAEPEKFSMRALMEKTTGKNAEYILRVIEGWSLDLPFDLENVQQLADELPLAAQTIMDDYHAACTRGRLGN
jgi:hypothetical protein